MTAKPQPTMIPTMDPTDRATPWLRLSLSAFDVEGMMGDAGEPGLEVSDVGDGEDTELAVVKDCDTVSWSVLAEIEVVVGTMDGCCWKRVGQPIGVWAQGSTRQHPL